MPLDLIDAYRLGDAGHLIKIAGVIPQIGIVGDAPQIAFEMAVINAVKADQRREQPPVSFRDAAINEIALAR